MARLSRFAPLFLIPLLTLPACSTIGFKEENDFFTLVNEDRFYSQGMELTVRDGESEYGLGHRILTPDNKWREDLIREDRPYAGYLYGAFSRPIAHGLGAGIVQTIRLELGIVGPTAQGEAVQNRFHDLIGDARFLGWDNQLRDEPVATVAHTTSLPLSFSGPTLTPYVTVSAGNMDTSLRVGSNLTYPIGRVGAFDVEGVAGLTGAAKAIDLTLDGNTWKGSHSVNKETFVANATAGICFRRGKLFFGYLFRRFTREFEGQKGDGHSYGSVLLGWGECG